MGIVKQTDKRRSRKQTDSKVTLAKTKNIRGPTLKQNSNDDSEDDPINLMTYDDLISALIVQKQDYSKSIYVSTGRSFP